LWGSQRGTWIRRIFHRRRSSGRRPPSPASVPMTGGPCLPARDLPSGGLLGRRGILAGLDPALCRGPVAQLG
jgi:hypothetical protein